MAYNQVPPHTTQNEPIHLLLLVYRMPRVDIRVHALQRQMPELREILSTLRIVRRSGFKLRPALARPSGRGRCERKPSHLAGAYVVQEEE